jgi:alkaline phosphatase
MNQLFKTLVLLTIWISSTSFFPKENDKQLLSEPKHAKNIILLIGDGMGLAQMYSAYTANFGILNMLRCPYIGLSRTCSIDNYITDSAAGATAMATGQKTKNRMIAIDTLGKPLKTILEISKEKGLAVGLVATNSITDATPAAFISHTIDRKMSEYIALDFLKTDIDVFVGGGKNYFTLRKDGKNLTNDLKNKGYQVLYNFDSINNISSGKLAGFTSDEDNPAILKGRGDILVKSTNTAIRLLSNNKKGFFLMVEGSQIDKGGHENNSQKVISETLDFDHAVGVALDFAAKDSNTLVIITADHETGGLSLTDGSLKNGTSIVSFSTKHHTGIPVPVYAFGPCAEKFTGFYDNTEIFRKMMTAYNFSEDERKK